MKNLPVRKQNRLKKYYYSQNNTYFITICVKDKHEILGQPVGAISNRPQNDFFTTNEFAETTQNKSADKLHIELSEYGMIVDKAIKEIPVHYKNVSVDKYVIMPNHIHFILAIKNDEADGRDNDEADKLFNDETGRRFNGAGGRLLIAPTYLVRHKLLCADRACLVST